MVAYELLHSMKAKKRERVGSMAIKPDMSKAYDRIEWFFLESVMKKFGLCSRWVEMILGVLAQYPIMFLSMVGLALYFFL